MHININRCANVLLRVLNIRGETAARRPLLALDLRIPFSCQETGREESKMQQKWQAMASEVRKGGGSETEKKL